MRNFVDSFIESVEAAGSPLHRAWVAGEVRIRPPRPSDCGPPISWSQADQTSWSRFLEFLRLYRGSVLIDDPGMQRLADLYRKAWRLRTKEEGERQSHSTYEQS